MFATAEMIADSVPSLSPVPIALFFSLLLYKQLKSHAFFSWSRHVHKRIASLPPSSRNQTYTAMYLGFLRQSPYSNYPSKLQSHLSVHGSTVYHSI